MRLIALLFSGILLTPSYGAELLMVQSGRADESATGLVRKLSEFYGLKLSLVDAGSPGSTAGIMARLKQEPRPVAVLSMPGALAQLDRTSFLPALHSPVGREIPMLVFDIRADSDTNELTRWSNGAIHGCAAATGDARAETLIVGSLQPVTRTLTGAELPAVTYPVCSMQIESARKTQRVLSIKRNGRTDAVLIRTLNNKAEVFFAPQMKVKDTSWIGNPLALPQAVSSMAPFLFFLSYASGDYGWHSDRHYANLTIDDPWLTPRYGRLDYWALLAEMEKHNFHTTIAFIPWNFDRSDPGTVSLFRAYKERFSIAIHGNNHLHQEFGNYRDNSLQKQITDVKQAVARMERFQVLTGLPYDRFMVFPHSIAPEPTIAALKGYGFLGTANSLNVPLGIPFPADATFLLRPYTRQYADFLSLFRYSANAEIPQQAIAIQSFLGNPLLFYGHEDLFGNGIGAFDGFADFVNRIQPDTRWTSLGDIARHLYLIRRSDDREFDVRMFSNEIYFENSTGRDATFQIESGEEASTPIRALTVNNAPVAYEHSSNGLRIRLAIPAGQTRKIQIHYRSELDLSPRDMGHKTLSTWLVREISDFRDVYLSRLSWGRALARAYYHRGWNLVEVKLERRWLTFAGCIGLLLVGAALAWRGRRARTRRVSRTDSVMPETQI